MPSSSSPKQRCSVVGCSVNSVACWRPVERPSSGSCLRGGDRGRQLRLRLRLRWIGISTSGKSRAESPKAWHGDGEKSWPIQRGLEGRAKRLLRPDELTDSRNTQTPRRAHVRPATRMGYSAGIGNRGLCWFDTRICCSGIFVRSPPARRKSGFHDERVPRFAATLPAWILVAKLYGLYDNDHERTNHSTADEITSTFHLITTGVAGFAVVAWFTGLANVAPAKLLAFWAIAFCTIIGSRLTARAICRRSVSFQQNTLIVGAGDVGQLVARKIKHHPEYGLNVVGFVDNDPEGSAKGAHGCPRRRITCRPPRAHR